MPGHARWLVLTRLADEVGPLTDLAAEADLCANLYRLGMAAGPDDPEWTQYADLVGDRLGVELGGWDSEDGP